jgi:hypothetical protein
MNHTAGNSPEGSEPSRDESIGQPLVVIVAIAAIATTSAAARTAAIVIPIAARDEHVVEARAPVRPSDEGFARDVAVTTAATTMAFAGHATRLSRVHWAREFLAINPEK